MIIQFQQYIRSNYDSDCSEEILEYHKNKKNKRIFNLSLKLIIWSLLSISIDLIMAGAGGWFTVESGLGILTFAPTLLFLFLNTLAKYIFVHYYLGNSFTIQLKLKAVIPYIGPGFLLNDLISNNPNYKLAIREYLKFYKKEIYTSVFQKTS